MFHPMETGQSRDKDYIINMEQLPIPFTFERKRTVDFVGTGTLHMRKSTCDTKWATLAITIMASGKN